MYVDDAHFSSDVDESSTYLADLGAPIAVDADGILVAQSIAALATVTTFATSYSSPVQPAPLGKYGRNVTMIASGAATSGVRVDGRDYLGQPITETFVLAGAATVAGKKAFAHIEQVVITSTTGATTINVGWGDVLGLPYKAHGVLQAYEAGLVAAGTFVTPILVTQTATTGDPRGTYDPVAACNGVVTVQVLCKVDKTNLYGEPHFRA